MDLKQRIEAFAALGNFMAQIAAEYDDPTTNDTAFNDHIHTLKKAEVQNGWFTPESISFALKNWAEVLTKENLENWISPYHFPERKTKTIAVIMAGNIPLVGFHDFLSVLISGNRVKAKLSSNDRVLLPFLSDFLISINSEFNQLIEFVSEKMENFDAVTATGSNNTARYFDYYFGKYPHIIRRNRNSVAILSGKENLHELELLSDDIFRYFGLGCRNVSKIFIPKGYNFELFFKACYKWKDIIHNNKYINNYDYNKAVYLMDNLPLLDNEFLILKEDPGFSSPIGVLFYEFYDNQETLDAHIKNHLSEIQAVISSDAIPFGSAQNPKLSDYADNVNTLDFLVKISS